jgi:CheY-like chemotaxis protein
VSPAVASRRVAPALSASEAPVVDGHGMSVLVVEDNRDVGTFATDALSELGYTTVLRPNAQEALGELARHATHYDVVFSDVVMPGMTGIKWRRKSASSIRTCRWC